MASSSCSPKRSATYLIPSLVLPAVLTLLLLPWIWRLAGLTLGWYLRRKTEGRRQRIFEVMAEEEESFQQQAGDKAGRDEDEWENVEAYAVGSAGNGEKGQRDWDGVVGFFHPFWCVALLRVLPG